MFVYLSVFLVEIQKGLTNLFDESVYVIVSTSNLDNKKSYRVFISNESSQVKKFLMGEAINREIILCSFDEIIETDKKSGGISHEVDGFSDFRKAS